jgi:hypothetical protein
MVKTDIASVISEVYYSEIQDFLNQQFIKLSQVCQIEMISVALPVIID